MSMTATGPWPVMRPCAGCASVAREGREGTGEEGLQRFAAAGEAWVGHEIAMCVEKLLTLARANTARRAVGKKLPALLVVLEVRHHDLVEHLRVHGGIGERHHRLDAAVEVARHHVRRADVDDRLL